MFIFLDESGDLGFDFVNKKPSSAFTITLLVCARREVIQDFGKAVKRTLRNKLNHKKSSRVINELKGNEISPSIKQYFMRNAPNAGWCLYSVTLNKHRVKPHLRDKVGKKKLYNFCLVSKICGLKEAQVVYLKRDIRQFQCI